MAKEGLPIIANGAPKKQRRYSFKSLTETVGIKVIWLFVVMPGTQEWKPPGKYVPPCPDLLHLRRLFSAEREELHLNKHLGVPGEIS